ncbi:CBS domain-containing protein [Nonomuraea aurantiaca]|uniref:CBS domain-containing protein n=1 Tax=Nonomuraea aurantiaca TaxID=2878562 RepID=UPI001CD99806|nr:CBS domain-containing protein [Nonomuraea aurantiaca]MCA2229236.1 CBS domain-containing protein [Nonomuraea aurantiaca]
MTGTRPLSPILTLLDSLLAGEPGSLVGSLIADLERLAMRARDLLAAFPTVTADAPVIEAARLLAEQDLPGLIVVDDAGLPVSILAGTQVLALAVPRYCQDDPALARVVDEKHADAFLSSLVGRTVRQALPPRPRELPVTDPDATVLELAALMARTRTPLVAVVEGGRLLGAVTLQALMDRVVPS